MSSKVSRSRLSLRAKLITSFLLLGIVPALVTFFTAKHAVNSMVDESAEVYESAAFNVLDKIDRNLFERYGDVQAFGFNDVVEDKSSWYAEGSSLNKISARMNDYVIAYGVYDLAMMVDTAGRVVAVNDKTLTGKPLDTRFMYDENFASAAWFIDAMKGNFYTGEGLLTGTVVEDTYVDEYVKRLYNNEGYVIGFAAPVKNAAGEIIGVWKNFASFKLVEDIIRDDIRDLKNRGLADVAITLLGVDGTVWADFDLAKHDVDGYVRKPHIGKQNAREWGLEATARALAGDRGFIHYKDPKTSQERILGYGHSQSILGFKGMGWSAFVHVSRDVALATVAPKIRMMYVVLAFSTLVILGAAWLITRSILVPVHAVIHNLKGSVTSLGAAADDLSEGAQSMASGSAEQAAAIQETVASMSEITSMLAQTSDYASQSRDLASGMARQTEEGVQTVQSMVDSMSRLEEANQELQQMVGIIREISNRTSVINDIVFKTQLLSFNASIEAARAGQHGRGFAVVAEEVGNLADLSGTAAKEIQALLDQSQSRVNEIVDLTKKRVSQGQEIAKKTLALFEHIAGDVQSVAGQVQSIHDATREQEGGIQQTSIAMAQMDKVAQQSTALSNSVSHSSEELQDESRRIRSAFESLQALAYGAGGSAPAEPARESDQDFDSSEEEYAQTDVEERGQNGAYSREHDTHLN